MYWSSLHWKFDTPIWSSRSFGLSIDRCPYINNSLSISFLFLIRSSSDMRPSFCCWFCVLLGLETCRDYLLPLSHTLLRDFKNSSKIQFSVRGCWFCRFYVMMSCLTARAMEACFRVSTYYLPSYHLLPVFELVSFSITASDPFYITSLSFFFFTTQASRWYICIS